MKVAYFDCFSGISGDMLIGSLLDAGLEFSDLQHLLAGLRLENVELKHDPVVRKNISATKFDVHDSGEKVYRHLPDLNRIVDESNLDENIKTQAKRVFLTIAEAEARCHGVPLQKVHFHEVGAVDTIVDVVGALSALKLLRIEKVMASKLNVGSGTVEFSHGIFPVPAPATADILKDVPVYATDSQGELVTPTGAAIITSIADRFGTMPAMNVQSIGYGAGTREMATPNVLRVFIGELDDEGGLESDVVSVLESNIDDMNPEIYQHVFEKLLAAGALDVFISNISMKKNRPGHKLTVLTEPGSENKLAQIILAETTSLGIRYRSENRLKLQREIRTINTSLGDVPFKIAYRESKVVHYAPEYESCKKIADSKGIPLKSVYQTVQIEAVKIINKLA